MNVLLLDFERLLFNAYLCSWDLWFWIDVL